MRGRSSAALLLGVVALAACTRTLAPQHPPPADEARTQDEVSRAQAETLARQRDELARNQELLDELRGRHLDARETSRGVVVNLPDVLFEIGRATRSARCATSPTSYAAPRAAGRSPSRATPTRSAARPTTSACRSCAPTASPTRS